MQGGQSSLHEEQAQVPLPIDKGEENDAEAHKAKMVLVKAKTGARASIRKAWDQAGRLKEEVR
jgi:hypothetical protein